MSASSRPARSLSRLALALALGTALGGVSAGAALAEFKLNILHLNDPHSRIEPINRFDSTCSAEDDEAGECFGGFARLKTLIEEQRDQLEGPTLVISAGDHFQGSLFYTTYKGEGEAEMASALGIDLFALGNHEFDNGPEELRAFLDNVEFPVLGANVATELEGIADRVDPYVVADIGGERIGFVGAVASDTAETSSPGPDISFEDDIEALRDAVERVKAEGVEKIIAVTHVGLARDREIAESISDIDLIIGGHSHTLMLNEGEDAEGAEPYPVVVNDTPIVQAYAYTKYLGQLVLTFDDDGNLQRLAGDPILVDSSIEKDPKLDARIQEMLGPIEELKAQVVGETTAPIDGDRTSCRAGECEMGNLVADAMLDRVADQGIDIAIQNGGGLRASIDEGEITMGEVLTVLPFQNTLATFQLKGSDILASLENGVSEIEEGGGRFPQVAGMSYSFDASKPVGERVSDVMIGGEPLDPEATYGVVSNNFMRGGGDGYERFDSGAENAYDFGPGLEQVLADYIAENGPITPQIDGRITNLSSDADSDAGEETADGETDATAAAGAEVATANTATDDAGDEDSSGEDVNAEADTTSADGDEMRPADMADGEAAAGVSDAEQSEDAAIDSAAAEAESESETEGSEGEAAEAIEDAVELAEESPLDEPPAIEGADADAEGADASAADASATDAVSDEEPETADAATGDNADDAEQTINEAVELTTDAEPLATPPEIEGETDGASESAVKASDASDGDNVAEATVEEAAETATQTPNAQTPDAEAMADGTMADEGASTDASTEDVASNTDASANESTEQTASDQAATDAIEEAAEIATQTPSADATDGDAPTDTADGRSDSAVEQADTSDATGTEASETEAAETINEAVESSTDTAALSEPPTVPADNAADDISSEETTADSTDTAVSDEAIEEAAEIATSTPSADVNEDTAAADADASQVESDTSETAEAGGDSATESGEEAANASDASASETANVAATSDEPRPDESETQTAAVETINDAVEDTTDADALSSPPSVEADASTADGTEEVETAQAAADNSSLDTASDGNAASGDDGAASEETDGMASDTAEAGTDDANTDEASAETADSTNAASDSTAQSDAPGDATEADDGAEQASSDAGATDTADTDSADTDAVEAEQTDEMESAASGNDMSNGEASDSSSSDGSTDDGSTASENAEADDGSSEYTVKAGDSYWSIAGEVYGDPKLYRIIERANAENPRSLQIGSVITIPARPE